jgi:hypothetical protein
MSPFWQNDVTYTIALPENPPIFGQQKRRKLGSKNRKAR